jgi:hypothetical protein
MNPDPREMKMKDVLALLEHEASSTAYSLTIGQHAMVEAGIRRKPDGPTLDRAARHAALSRLCDTIRMAAADTELKRRQRQSDGKSTYADDMVIDAIRTIVEGARFSLISDAVDRGKIPAPRGKPATVQERAS